MVPIPTNRRLLISPIYDEEETTSGVLLPENYKTKNTKYIMAEVRAVAVDSKLSTELLLGDKVFVESSMIEQLSVLGFIYHLILENYVVAYAKRHEE